MSRVRGAAAVRSGIGQVVDIAARASEIAARQWPVALLSCLATYCVALAATGAVETLADRQIAIIAAAAALFAGLAFESARGVIASGDRVERATGLAVLATVPDISVREMRYVSPDERVPHRFLVSRPASAFAASIRTLKRNTGARSGLIAIVPVTPNDGATTLALSLAAAGWMEAQSVIVVDCDARRRSASRWAEDYTTLPDADGARVDPASEIRILPCERFARGQLDFANSAEFAQLLDSLQRRYDLVVLDCPPALLSADARMIARIADLSILVARRNKTAMRALDAAAKTMRRAKVLVGGVALTAAA